MNKQRCKLFLIALAFLYLVQLIQAVVFNIASTNTQFEMTILAVASAWLMEENT